MTEDPKKKIVQLFNEGTRDLSQPARTVKRKSIEINGDSNIVAGRDVHFHEAPKPPAPAKSRPGIDHITPEQRKTLRRLVEEIAETEARLKQRPKGFSAVYSALFRQFEGVTKLEQIPLDGFDSARSYLDQWLGRLNSSKSASVKNVDAWRTKKYRYIKVNTKNPEDAEALARYILRNFKANSLTELANDELEKSYRYIAGRKNAKR